MLRRRFSSLGFKNRFNRMGGRLLKEELNEGLEEETVDVEAIIEEYLAPILARLDAIEAVLFPEPEVEEEFIEEEPSKENLKSKLAGKLHRNIKSRISKRDRFGRK